ncbi:MAG: competence/damage-inducible protein A [Vicinamibacteria bacterium]
MRAEIIAVGSELIDPLRRETNGAYITGRLRSVGVDVLARTTVADDASWLEQAFRQALSRADVVIATGGLGPTADDLTREAAARAAGRGLNRDAGLLETLEARFARFGRVMAPVNAQQADLIDGGVSLPNARGSAPGQYLDHEGRLLFLLPGPPGEMQPMFDGQVLPIVRARAGGRALVTRVLKIASMGESDVEQVVAPLYKTFENPRTTILGGAGQTELHLTGEGATEAEAAARVEELASGIQALLPGRIYSDDGRDLAEVVAALLTERPRTLALAESCTGGLVAARLTAVPGSSAFFDRGYVTYSNRAKVDLLGVDPSVLERHGAVSEETARAMAEGARRAAGSDLAVAITGIAGPTGATEDKPVGLVFLALAGDGLDRVRRAQFPGERDRVRAQAAQAALELIRRAVLGLAPV